MNPRKTTRPKSPGLRIRIDLAPQCSVGPGKISLLEAIEREGSLSVAARRIGMSYRRAWNLIADLNGSFSRPVVATAVGGARGGGAQVTEYGRALVAAFRAFERGARRLAARQLREFEPVGTGARDTRRGRVSVARRSATRGAARRRC
jgi:molybdate transport system regulatory protein